MPTSFNVAESDQRQRLAELAGTWDLDPAHTSVELSVRHMMVATVRGRVQVKEGKLILDGDDATRSQVSVVIDAASVDTGNADRDAHLKSPEFLDVAQFPEILFRSTEVDDRGDGLFRLRGGLTVKNVTQPVTLEGEFGGVVRDPFGNLRIGFEATGSVDRTEFGLTWNKIMEGGGLVAGDRVKLTLDAEFVRADPTA